MFLEHKGARLFATTLGSGPDLVLLHPTPTHHAFWLRVAEHLQRRFRLTLVDLRGHGQSTLGDAPPTMQQLAEDLHAVLDALSISTAAFAGCSIGGYVLYEYWRRFPQQVTALAFCCSKPQPDTHLNREKRQQWMQQAQQPGGLAAFLDHMAEALVGPSTQQQHPKVRQQARAMMQPFTLPAMLAIQQALAARPDSVPTLRTMNAPVCAIAGGEDQSSTPDEMHVIAQQAPGAQFHRLAHAGHYAPLEQPEIVSSILHDFFHSALSRPSH